MLEARSPGVPSGQGVAGGTGKTAGGGAGGAGEGLSWLFL